jgi:hypothetical protein
VSKSFWLRLIVYGLAFILGESYLIVLFADLKWPRTLLFLAIMSWGVLLGSGVHYALTAVPVSFHRTGLR